MSEVLKNISLLKFHIYDRISNSSRSSHTEVNPDKNFIVYPSPDFPQYQIDEQYLGFKHDLMRYGTAVFQLFLFVFWLVAGVLFSLTFVLWVRFDKYESLISVISKAASVTMFPTVLILFIAFLFPYTGINPKRITDWDTPLVFRWSTRGTNPLLVRHTVSESFQAMKKFGNFVLEVATDHPIGIPENTLVTHPCYRELLIPEDYICPNGSKFKARGLHYGAITSLAPRDAYIVHLDEESIVTEEFFLGIREFVSHNKGYIGQGIITYARESKRWQSWVAWLMDAVRVGDDYGRFRIQLLLGRILVGMKGSYMVIPNEFEQDVGFDHGVYSSITEDCWFAFCFPDKVRFCPGKLVEQSPFNLMDVVKQRRRWATGLWKVVLHHPTPWYNKLFLGGQMVTWLFAWLNFASVICGFALSEYYTPIELAIYNGFVFGIFKY
jgi:egghead protein (zeste-white 4 protein)